jgi:TRAP-type C4-dicarboxylate transport system permease small subunit
VAAHPSAQRHGTGAAAFARRFDAFCGRLNLVVEVVIGLLLGAAIIVALLQVVFRYGLNSSLSWSEELARYLFIWIIFLGTSSAARRGQHMAVETLASVLPAVALRPLTTLVIMVSIVFYCVVFYTAVILTENAIPQLSTALEISVAIVYVSAPIGAALTIIHLINGLVQIAAGRQAVVTTVTDIS